MNIHIFSGVYFSLNLIKRERERKQFRMTYYFCLGKMVEFSITVLLHISIHTTVYNVYLSKHKYDI